MAIKATKKNVKANEKAQYGIPNWWILIWIHPTPSPKTATPKIQPTKNAVFKSEPTRDFRKRNNEIKMTKSKSNGEKESGKSIPPIIARK